MTVAAEFGSGQVLWSIVWFFLFALWMYLIVIAFFDIFRSPDLSGWGKALWGALVLLLPFLGVFIYLIARGDKMHERSATASHDEAMQLYLRGIDGGSSHTGSSHTGSSDADELQQLADLHTAGKLDDAEYASAKARALG